MLVLGLGNTYSSSKAGIWSVTASLGGAVGNSQLNVNHASATDFAVSPQNSTATAGQNQAFSATAYDAYREPMGCNQLYHF